MLPLRFVHFALPHGEQVQGLLQVNDCARGRSTPEIIAFLESLADQIALALALRQAQGELRRNEPFKREMMTGAQEGIAVYDRDFRDLAWNLLMEEMTGLPARLVLRIRRAGIFSVHQRVTTMHWHCRCRSPKLFPSGK